MEGPYVESPTEPVARPVAQFDDFHLAELVGQRLSRPGDVAVDFSLDVLLIHGGVLAEEFEHLLA